MCYYATTDYSCGDWKWGNMMLRCPRQHRIGETCGAKLIHSESITRYDGMCKTCDEISTKQRRLSKTRENISRWNKEPEKFSASLEKARREAKELEERIKDLHLRRSSVATSITGATSAVSSRSVLSSSAAATTLPPVASIAAPATSRYEYTSAQGMSRRQENGTHGTPRHPIPMAAVNHHAVGSVTTSTASPLGVLPPVNYVSRGGGIVPSANVSMDRPGGAYTVSYVRR